MENLDQLKQELEQVTLDKYALEQKIKALCKQIATEACPYKEYQQMKVSRPEITGKAWVLGVFIRAIYTRDKGLRFVFKLKTSDCLNNCEIFIENADNIKPL